jgi:uncharacterized protein YabN with tetrapyrrole methylase and pyrophosphatase domain
MFDEKLIVLGTGIRIVGQLTMESIAYLRRATTILHVVEDSVAIQVFRSLNPDAEIIDMVHLYVEGQLRIETYQAMIQQILESVRTNALTVCAFYGHPGVMAYPGHEAIRLARAAGYKSRMLPAISAEDCLFADLGVDPATYGCQSFEATDIIWNERVIDPTCNVVLWQVGSLGDATYHAKKYDLSALPTLIEKLLKYYPPSHGIILYEAAVMMGFEPRIMTMRLDNIVADIVTPRSTWLIPPVR